MVVACGIENAMEGWVRMGRGEVHVLSEGLRGQKSDESDVIQNL